MAQAAMDLLSSMMGSCLSCFPGSSPTLKINGRGFKILRLLGEGGFSYVYLVQDTSSGETLALKKIRCPFGAESVAQAMREVDAYRLFGRRPGMIHAIDHSVANERGSGGVVIGGGGGGGAGDQGADKTVYILLPYYRRGNLQDLINANLVNHTRFPERRLMLLFLGVCKALREMHEYRSSGDGDGEVGGGGINTKFQKGEVMEMRANGANGGDEAGKSSSKGKGKGKGRGSKKARAKAGRAETAEEGDSAGTRLPAGEGGADEDDESEQQRPLMLEHSGVSAPGGEARSYAHRDIKPGNIMIADNGADPILMDLGSVAESPLHITSRSLAIATQDTAAEHSTMPYRAPELFDVKTGAVIDTKVDIWSLGCTLYACLVGKSPFEMRSDETGGSLSICVLSGDWRFPDEGKKTGNKGKGKGKVGGGGVDGGPAAGSAGPAGAGGGDDESISEPIREVVRRCLRVEPSERPDVNELIEMVERVVGELSGDDDA